MAVGYVVVPRLNLQDRQGPRKFYAQTKSKGELTFRRLSKEIAEAATTVSDTDVLAALNILTKFLIRHLENGEIVRLGDFGTFQISIGSEGSETESEFNPSMIKNPKVIFRPGIDLKEMLANLNFEKLK